MKYTTMMMFLLLLSIILLQVASNDVSADDEIDNEFGPCWGVEWDDVWWGAGMMIMMSVGFVILITILVSIFKIEYFKSPPTNNAVSIQPPSSEIYLSSQLEQRYARGEISRDEFISQSLDDFINRFTEEE